MRHPKDIGDSSTLAIILALQDQGWATYLPFGENTRCDIVVDDGRKLSRVQCKTGRLRNGTVIFKTCSSYAHHRNARVATRTYAGEIDAFAVYCPELGGVYLVPIEDVPVTSAATLRVMPPRNRQTRRVRRATTYEIARVDVY